MKFIVDAQLPFGLKLFINNRGYDAKHTDDLPNKEKTTDNEILELALNENRIVITKDKDFLNGFLIKSEPKKLILISTGNITNKKLFQLFTNNWNEIITQLSLYNFIELSNNFLICK